MDKKKPEDIDILQLKKKKRSATEKKKNYSPPKAALRSSNRSDSHNLINANKNKLNLNKKDGTKNPDSLGNNSFNSNWETMKSSLQKMQEMIIKQESDILEAVTGCQEPNNYHVYGKLPNGDKDYIFKFREFSSCGMRFWCPVSCRQLIMKIRLISDDEDSNANKNNDNDDDYNEEEFNNSLIYIEKSCKCPCFNCVRPEMKVFISGSNTLLGRIEEAFSCCDPIFRIYDNNGKIIYHIESDCCQCGFMCRNNCFGKTDECVFFIYNSEKKENPIGEISKKAAASLLSIADNYSVIFPKNANFEQKILLSIAGVMIDYQYFEKNANTVR